VTLVKTTPKHSPVFPCKRTFDDMTAPRQRNRAPAGGLARSLLYWFLFLIGEGQP